MEYRLIRGMLNEKTIIEVYGDELQKVTENRGIDSWSHMKMLLGEEYYELKENYRNTVDVADYVNNNVVDAFVSIGFHGEKVRTLGSEWINEARREINKYPKKRIAIICKDKAELDENVDSVTIARSRRHIEKYYDTCDIGTFPKRKIPISTRPGLTDLDKAINYNEIFEQLCLLSLCIYTPTMYILPSKIEKYMD